MRKKLFTFLLALAASVGLLNAAVDGKLPGAFTVDGSGTQVYFSQGNLQYTGSWQFAANQWDVIGASQTDDNRDLFSWGTGDAPNWENNMGGDWRTLTKDEWKYLFLTRDNAATLFALGKVNGKKGVILLPDAWVLPDGASFNASSKNGFEKMGSTYLDDDYTNDHFQDNTYTTEQWAVMESAGAVFLPAAGYRESSNSKIYYVGEEGYYWSATPNDDEAYYISFSSEHLGTQHYNTRNDGRSVRLVSVTAPSGGSTSSETTVTWDLSDMASMGTQGGYFKAKGITLMAYGVDNGMTGDGMYGGAYFGGPFVLM